MIESMIRRDQFGKHECTTCGKFFDTKQRVKRHVEVHLSIANPCIVCEKVFRTRNALSTHYTRHHQEVVSPWTMEGK